MASRKRLISSQIDVTETQVDAFVLRLEKLIRLTWGKTLARFEAGKVDAREAVSMLGSLYGQLEKAGLGERLGELRKIYAKELEFVRDSFREQGIRDAFSEADRSVVEALIKADVSKVTNKLEAYVDDARSVLYRSVLIGQKPLLDFIDDFDGALGNNLRTELRTATIGFSRSVNIRKAKELGFSLFEYIGPDDDITRPFCEELLGEDPPIFSLEEIQALDNGQGLDVFAYCGGYNCRHGWYAISEEDARAQGWEP